MQENAMAQQVDYGNWIRLRIIRRVFLVTLILTMITVLPFPLFVRVALWGISGGLFFVFLYLISVYHLLSDTGGNLQAHIRQLVLDRLLWDGNGKALDIGTGNGALAVRLAERYPESMVYGVDVWEAEWEYAQETCEQNARLEGVGDRVHFEKRSAAQLGFPDEAFEAVISHFVFHEVACPDTREVIHEGLRVVRQGGAFAFQDMFLDATLYGSLPELLKLIRTWGIRDVQFVATKDLMTIPALLRNRRALGYAGILYGRK
jgi:ubiquinone/menaquinone biosynthesis C-methylase UbiE